MYHDLAKMTTTTTGTGTITLGSAVTGFLSFADAEVVDGEMLTFVIEDGDAREFSIGKYTASGTTLTRERVLSSTNGGAKLDLSGNAVVFVALTSKDMFNINEYSPIILQDDFVVGGIASTGNVSQLCWSFANGTWGGYDDSVEHHPGINRRSGSANTSVNTLYLGSGAAVLGRVRLDQLDEMVIICRFFSSFDSNYNIRFGFQDTKTSSPNYGVFIERLAADDGFYGAVLNAGNKTRTARILTHETTQYHKLRIRRISSTSWGFTVDGGTEVTITSDANIPDDFIVCFPFMFMTWNAGGTATRQVDFDYVHIKFRRQLR